ncbi:MAG: nitrogen fixation protein NifQ [Azospirillum sp.]|nr:nitrogen fixation protein NifQ [Azospirillum sp.]
MAAAGQTARLLFDAVVALAASETARPLTAALGLGRPALARLVQRHLPHRMPLIGRLPAETAAGADTLEEPDLRAYLLECRAGRSDQLEEETWWAAIVARRCQYPNHLWQDLGFSGRADLNAMLRRYFPELVRRNNRDMKWKKFFYRELCQREGVLICKAPVCDVCSDFEHCFGAEPGEPLARLAHQVDHPARGG